MLQKIKRFWQSVLKQLKDKTNIKIFIIVLLLMYAPTWLLLLLGCVFKNAALISTAIGYAVFWAGPCTPFFPIVIGITLFIRKILNKLKKRK
jgi:hypothetical protein